MINSFFNYALESSICLLLFAAVYRLLISNLTHFSWMRIYLILSLILSLILPVLILPIQWKSSIQTTWFYENSNLFLTKRPESSAGNNILQNDIQQNGSLNVWLGIIYMLIGVYCIGLLYKIRNFARNLRSILKCIRENPKKREGNYWLVYLMEQMPPFSFFNYIFLTNKFQSLSLNDLQRIKDHEIIHAKQYHSLDVLFIEFISIIFWFNPLLTYLKKSVQELHEYIVDEKIAGIGAKKKDYAQLLLTLASDVKGFNLSAYFTGQQIKRRLTMISKPRSSPQHKFVFSSLILLSAFLLVSFSYIKYPDTKQTTDQQNKSTISGTLVVGEIIWKGNTLFSNDELNKAFGLKKGDKYTIEDANRRMWNSDLPSLYLDSGHVFYRADLTENQKNGVVDLTITIYEGKIAKIGEIIIKGNVKVSSKEILRQIAIQSGDLFSKTKIINSIRAIAAMGKFDPEKINPKPIPDQEKSTDEYAIVDLLFEVTEINTR